MASKGPKNGAGKSVPSKAAALPKNAPKPKVAVVKAEKPEPRRPIMPALNSSSLNFGRSR